MKKAVLIFFLFVLGLSVQAQSYLGTVKRTVNFRAGSSTSSEKLGSLTKGAKLFLFSNKAVNDYYHAVALETGVEGYVYASYVEVGRLLPSNKEGIFKQVGKTLSSETTIRMNNKSTLLVTLKLNDETYTFAPGEKTVLNLPAGSYTFLVLATGLTPSHGTQNIEGGYEYIWSYSKE